MKDTRNWNAIEGNWARGVDYCVERVGRKWKVLDMFGNFPLYKTKKDAFKAVTNLILSH